MVAPIGAPVPRPVRLLNQDDGHAGWFSADRPEQLLPDAIGQPFRSLAGVLLITELGEENRSHRMAGQC